MKSDYTRRVIIIKEEHQKEKKTRYEKYWIPNIPLISALLIGGATLTIAFNSNLFDTNNKLLEIKKLTLDNEIKQREAKIKSVLVKFDSINKKSEADKKILLDTLAKLRGIEAKMISRFTSRIQNEIERLETLRTQRDSLMTQFNEQKRKIKLLTYEVQSLLNAGETKKANEKMKELLILLTKITIRIHSPQFDSTFD